MDFILSVEFSVQVCRAIRNVFTHFVVYEFTHVYYVAVTSRRYYDALQLINCSVCPSSLDV